MRCKAKKGYPMLKFNSFVFVFSLLLQSLIAQDKVIVGKNYYGNTINEKEICNMIAFTTRPEVSKAIENIVRRSGLKQNFYVMECPNTDNCFAATRNGERLIVYDPAFMRKINNFTHTDWAALSILAHEIGHHLQGHTIKQGGSEHEKELEADEFSGFVMYQMGAKLKEAQQAIFNLTTDYATSTHPMRSKRLKAIEVGYSNAKELYPDVNQGVREEAILMPKKEVLKPKRPSEENDEIVIGSINVESLPNEKPKKEVEPEKNRGCVSGNCSEGYGIAINGRSSERYEGGWKLGKRHGYGKEYYKDGVLKYEGTFANSVYNGNGTYYYKSGEKYSGNFYNGKMHGSQSIFYFKNGDRLFVDYIEGKKEGKARIVYYGGVEGVKFYRNDVELR